MMKSYFNRIIDIYEKHENGEISEEDMIIKIKMNIPNNRLREKLPEDKLFVILLRIITDGIYQMNFDKKNITSSKVMALCNKIYSCKYMYFKEAAEFILSMLSKNVKNLRRLTHTHLYSQLLYLAI